MITKILDWVFDKFQASGARGPLADRARARIRQARGWDAPARDEVADETPLGAPPLNRQARRAASAKRRKKPAQARR